MSSYPVIDADGHVREPYGLWDKYLPADLRSRGPIAIEGPYMTIDDVEFPPRAPYAMSRANFQPAQDTRFVAPYAAGWNAKSQLDAMDLEGIDVSVLFPSDGLLIMGADGVDPVMTTAIARAYNDWLADFCAESPGRLFAAAMLDPRDVPGAIAEAQRSIGEKGFLAAFIRPNPVGGRPWHHPDYEPLWSALAELDAPVCFHEGGAVMLPQIGPDRFREHALWHAATHPVENQLAMISMLLGGVAERHPDLRMAFLECGASWLPYWMWRLDEHFEHWEADFDGYSLKPSEYIRRQCFVSIDTDEEPGVASLESLGGAHVVWGSDYPHHDAKFPHALATLSSLPGMNDVHLHQVLNQNPLALFGERLQKGLQTLR